MKVSVKLRINCKLSNLCVLTTARTYVRQPLFTLKGFVSKGTSSTIDRTRSILASRDNIFKTVLSTISPRCPANEGTACHASNSWLPCPPPDWCYSWERLRHCKIELSDKLLPLLMHPEYPVEFVGMTSEKWIQQLLSESVDCYPFVINTALYYTAL